MKNDFPEYYDKFNELPRMIMKINDDICVSKRSLFHPLTKNNNQYIEGLKKKMGVTECTFVEDYGEIINATTQKRRL